MGKGNKHVLKAPKLKPNKTYYTPSNDETFIVIINPPRRTLQNGDTVPNIEHIQTWLSAIIGCPQGAVEEMYTIKTHPEPIIKLEDVDLATTPILGLHRWREFIRDVGPEHRLWNEQTVIAEYDVKRCNHPKNIQYQITTPQGPNPNMYAAVIQPYPHPHGVDLSRNDLGFRISDRAKQIINWNSFPKPEPNQPQNPGTPKTEQDPRRDQVFPELEQDIKDPRRNQVFDDDIEQELKAQARAESKSVDPRLEQVFDDVKQDVKMSLQEDSKTDIRGNLGGETVSPGQVKREDVAVKREDILVKQEAIPVKQEQLQVKLEDDPRHRLVFDDGDEAGMAAQTATTKAEPVEDVKPLAPRGVMNDANNASIMVKEERDARPFSYSQIQPRAGPDVVESPLVKQEDRTRSAEFGFTGDRGRETFPPPTPSSMNGHHGAVREGNQRIAVKRGRPEDDTQAAKRLKTED